MQTYSHPTENVELSRLQGAEYNPRMMPKLEMDRLKASLREFGFVSPIAARSEDLLVLGGHQRLAAMREILAEDGRTEEEIAACPIPTVLIPGIDDAKAKVLNVALNKIHGEWDYDKLSALFADVTDVDALALTGFNQSEVDDILALTSLDPLAGAPETLSDAEVQAVVDSQHLRLTIAFASLEEREKCFAALTHFGMTNGKDLVPALVRMAESASKLPAYVPPVRAKATPREKTAARTRAKKAAPSE